MEKNELQNGELDALAARLLKAGRLSGEEIDNIVSAPRIFDSIRARIASDVPKPVSQTIWFAWKPAAAMMAVAVLIASFGYFAYLNKPETAEVTRTSKPPAVLTVNGDALGTGFREAVPVEVEPESVRTTAIKTVYREPVRSSPPKPKRPEAKREPQFYAVSFTGDPKELALGGRVVRVELSRASLFAMGVNVPLENDSAVIRTDLLIGPDGVTRAMRLVE